MAKPNKLTETQIEKIWLSRVEGVSDADIGRSFGISRERVGAILYHLKQFGLPVPKPRVVRYKMLVERIKQSHPEIVKKASEIK